jgi:hypothetical protein
MMVWQLRPSSPNIGFGLLPLLRFSEEVSNEAGLRPGEMYRQRGRVA